MNLETSLARARALIELKRLSLAEKELSAALQLDPLNWDAKLLMARLFQVSGKSGEALQKVQECLAERPDDLMALAYLYEIQDERGEYAAAEATILQIIRMYPQYGHAWAEYARLMLKTGHMEKAIKLADEAVRLGPTDVGCNLIHCLVNLISGHGKGVEERIQNLVRANPEMRATLYVLLSKLAEDGRLKEASRIVQQLVRADPSDTNAVNLAVDIAVQKHWSMKIYWPYHKFGWAGSFGVWAVFVLLVNLGATSGNEGIQTAVIPLAIFYILYAVSSWIWPPLLKKWIRRRGVC